MKYLDQQNLVKAKDFVSMAGFPRIPGFTRLLSSAQDEVPGWDTIDLLAFWAGGEIDLYTSVENNAMEAFHILDREGDPISLAESGNLLVRQNAAALSRYHDVRKMADKESAVDDGWHVFKPFKVIDLPMEESLDESDYAHYLIPHHLINGKVGHDE